MEKSEKNNMLLELLKENWAHGRHVETERLSFISIYVVIVGGILAFVGENFKGEEFNIQNMYPNMYPVIAILLIYSFLGFSLSKKWGNVFDNHMMKIKEILMDLSSDNFDGPKYIVMQKYKPKQSILSSWKRTKNLFNVFYLIMITIWTFFLIYPTLQYLYLYFRGMKY